MALVHERVSSARTARLARFARSASESLRLSSTIRATSYSGKVAVRGRSLVTCAEPWNFRCSKWWARQVRSERTCWEAARYHMVRRHGWRQLASLSSHGQTVGEPSLGDGLLDSLKHKRSPVCNDHVTLQR